MFRGSCRPGGPGHTSQFPFPARRLEAGAGLAMIGPGPAARRRADDPPRSTAMRPPLLATVSSPSRAGRGPRRPRQAAEHPLHHGRRPRAHALSCYGSKINTTPEPRPDRPRGDAVHEFLRHQLDLHPQPRGDAHGEVFAHQRRPRLQPLRRPPADLGQRPPSRRLPHGDRRQVAPRQRADRLRRLDRPARPGDYGTPSSSPSAAGESSTRATAPTSSPTSPSNSSRIARRTGRSS